MKNYKLKIELLSDLCVTDGGVYNSSIDTDICYDKYGFPFIPAKRIKGCLRECALELADWGVEIDPDSLFGRKGKRTNCGKIRISDAYLDGYEEYLSEIKCGSKSIYHPQNVLNNFSYIRNQTSIDNETGVAKDNSLRSTRVVNKGLIFEANVSLIDETAEDKLIKCTKLLRNMGLARSRGFGEVKAKLTPYDNEVEVEAKPYNGENMLFYKLELLEPMICKSINGGETNSLDYIEGSKIIGLLANSINDNSQFIDIISDDSLVFSNAYIEKNDRRMTEVPAYIYAIKNNKINYINRLVFKDKDNEEKPRQINGMKHCYISFDGQILDQVSVDMEERYHHSRPEDKSIGHANDTADSKFYQISSINSGQTFVGFITGNTETLKAIYENLSRTDICYMGYGSASEYGKCRFSIRPSKEENDNTITGKAFVVTLNAPAIVYNRHAMCSTNFDDLLEEILVAAGLNIEDISKLDREATAQFMKYTNLGGYNVTWDARKPVISAFDKGTGIKLVFKEDVTLKTGQFMFIGERNKEGFGECSIGLLNDSSNEDDWVYAIKNTSQIDKGDGVVGKLGRDICRNLFYDHIKISAAHGIAEKELIKESARSTVSNMLLMCKEMNSMEQISNAVKERFDKTSDLKRDKKAIAEKILKKVEENADGMTRSFCEQMNIDLIELNLSNDEISRIYLQALLMELKYQIRAKKGDN